MSLIMSVDYGDPRNDYPTFVVGKKVNDKVHIMDTGFIKDLDLSKYKSESNITYIGEPADVTRFKKDFNIK
ncbi:hypothetical protein [Bacillus sp. T33-2]|uniref:hypothetical protein n=1 Tax=Bacillus sp. T33-2 TaxID=2054168 RepID=UPI000C784A0D|nr:hypothetical protein [Bacillus sp. T33-2]PLR99568.1 hypothetical protein CVD19_00460 [Bacillus sp. T33-2]